MNRLHRLQERIRGLLAQSPVPEDAGHAENTLKWLLRLEPEADQCLQIAALGHDLDRAAGARRARREQFADYDQFKAAHARNSARILAELMRRYRLPAEMIEDVEHLVLRHEVGGDARSDLLKDADGISFFEVNLPLYFQREGHDETLRRSVWGFRRLSARARQIVQAFTYGQQPLDELLRQAIRLAGSSPGPP